MGVPKGLLERYLCLQRLLDVERVWRGDHRPAIWREMIGHAVQELPWIGEVLDQVLAIAD